MARGARVLTRRVEISRYRVHNFDRSNRAGFHLSVGSGQARTLVHVASHGLVLMSAQDLDGVLDRLEFLQIVARYAPIEVT